MRFVVESDLARPPGEVFDRLADARNEPAWNSQVTRSELVSDGPVAQGSRFVTVNRGRSYDATITTHERPGRLVFEVTGGALDITASFAITPRSEGAHVIGDYDFRPKGAMRLMFPLMQGAVRRDLAKQSQGFKRFCEGS